MLPGVGPDSRWQEQGRAGEQNPKSPSLWNQEFWGSLKVSTSSSPVRDQLTFSLHRPFYLTVIMGASKFES